MTTKFFFVLLFTAVLLFQFATAPAQSRKNNYDDLAAEVLTGINRYREKKRLKPLVMNDIISKQAENHSSDMASGRVPFGHDGFDTRTSKIRKQVKPVYGWAENVAAGVETADAVVDLWLHSAGHKKNIEGSYNLTGIGIAKARDGQLYFTQIFIRKE